MKSCSQKLCIALTLLALFTLNSRFSIAFAQTTVFPIATNANMIELGGGFASSGSNFLVGYNQNDTNVFLQLVATNGTLAGASFMVGASEGEPRLAFGTTNYLAFWGDDYIQSGVDLYAQLVSASGVAVGPAFPLLSSASGFQAEQAIGFDGTNFLVVWEYYGGTATNSFYGEFVNMSGTVVSSPFLIGDAATGGAFTPDNDSEAALAFGLTNYLYAWQIKASDSPEEWSTYGVFISRNGSVNGPFLISQTNSSGYNPISIAFDATNYFVVWNRDAGSGYPNPSVWNVDGRFVSPGGSLVGNEFILVTNEAEIPSLAFDGGNYLLNWFSGTETNLFYQFLNRSANPIGPAFTIFQNLGTNNFLGGEVFCDNQRFVAGAEIGAAGFDSSGDLTNLFSAAIYGAIIPKSTTPPILTASNLTGRQFPLTLTGTPGINYAIQMATNLSSANWTAIITNSSTNATSSFNFTDTSATNKSRFYRAAMQ